VVKAEVVATAPAVTHLGHQSIMGGVVVAVIVLAAFIVFGQFFPIRLMDNIYSRQGARCHARLIMLQSTGIKSSPPSSRGGESGAAGLKKINQLKTYLAGRALARRTGVVRASLPREACNRSPEAVNA